MARWEPAHPARVIRRPPGGDALEFDYPGLSKFEHTVIVLMAAFMSDVSVDWIGGESLTNAARRAAAAAEKAWDELESYE